MPEIETYYEQYWESPEDYNDPTAPQRQALFRERTNLPKGAKILDVGCGRGEFCAFFKEMGLEAEGIDLSKTGIEYARKQHPGITFHTGATDNLLPEKAGSYDAVFSSEVIEHLFDVDSYLKAIHDLLKPGGTFVLTTPYHGLIKNIVIDFTNYAKHYDPLGQHIRFFDRKSLDMCLRKWGLVPQSWTGYGRPWPLWKSFFVVCEKPKT